jgi:hypothetical protein
VRLDGLSDVQFESQLKGINPEIALWKNALEGRQN